MGSFYFRPWVNENFRVVASSASAVLASQKNTVVKPKPLKICKKHLICNKILTNLNFFLVICYVSHFMDHIAKKRSLNSVINVVNACIFLLIISAL